MIGSLPRALLVLAASSAAVITVAGCSSAGTSAGPPASTSPAISSPAASPSSATGSATGCATGTWQSVPLSVTHTAPVPPVPVITAVRTAQHPECGYDRLVLDITGALPSYSIGYVTAVTGDPSGQPIALPGQRFLLITLREAQAHSLAGTPTISSQAQVPGYPALQSWVVAGDNEGVVTLAVGLPRQVSIRAGELPGHLYFDFKQ